MMKKLTIDDGSFRDPDARIAYLNDSVYRIVYQNGFKKFDFVKKILENKSVAEYLIETEVVRQQEFKLLNSSYPLGSSILGSYEKKLSS